MFVFSSKIQKKCSLTNKNSEKRQAGVLFAAYSLLALHPSESLGAHSSAWRKHSSYGGCNTIGYIDPPSLQDSRVFYRKKNKTQPCKDPASSTLDHELRACFSFPLFLLPSSTSPSDASSPMFKRMFWAFQLGVTVVWFLPLWQILELGHGHGYVPPSVPAYRLPAETLVL